MGNKYITKVDLTLKNSEIIPIGTTITVYQSQVDPTISIVIAKGYNVLKIKTELISDII